MNINELIIKLNRKLFEFEYDSTINNMPNPSKREFKRKFPILKRREIKNFKINELDMNIEITFVNKVTHKVPYNIIDITKQGGF